MRNLSKETNKSWGEELYIRVHGLCQSTWVMWGVLCQSTWFIWGALCQHTWVMFSLSSAPTPTPSHDPGDKTLLICIQDKHFVNKIHLNLFWGNRLLQVASNFLWSPGWTLTHDHLVICFSLPDVYCDGCTSSYFLNFMLWFGTITKHLQVT